MHPSTAAARSVGLLAAFAVAVSACEIRQATPFTSSHRAAIADSVLVVLNQYADAVNGGNLQDILAFYADDPNFHWVENGSVAYPSHETVATAIANLQGAVRDQHFEMGVPRIVPLAPGVATVSVTVHQYVADTTGAETDVDGMLTLTVVHRASGWRFVSGHLSQRSPAQ